MDDSSTQVIGETTRTRNASGLSDSEVSERVARGQVNQAEEPDGRSGLQILRANAFTPINAIMLVLFALVVISGNLRDGLFVGVVVSNTVVGVTQEVRARRELQKLQVLTEPKATVVRNGTQITLESAAVVIDDLVVLMPGDQVPVDGEVQTGTGLQLDESMLTGESEPVAKSPGDSVLSGSFVAAGSGQIYATAVGASSYAAGLATEAKAFRAAESQLRQSVDRILKWLTIIIPLASSLLLLSLLDSEPRWQNALQGTVAAAVAMVPDGLVLLTSLAFVAGVLELSRRNALAKQLSTVEVLARVDVLCLDKTGTITTGNIVFAGIHPLNGHTVDETREALAALASGDEAMNTTMKAISNEVGMDSKWKAAESEPFSSDRKWSAIRFEERGWYYLGAPDILLHGDEAKSELIEQLNASGQRLIALVSSDLGPDGNSAPTESSAIAIIELCDEIRPDANDILAYFADQSVTIKVISGDNPETVGAIAERVGLIAHGRPTDARSLLDDESALEASLLENDIFGRVAPRQKQAMVHALQRQGHVVAMTGDGVNDVLALKDADLGIAMGSGSAASRSVADLVLTDDSFATLPIVVAEGRKVINNVERVANLFVSKAVYAVLLTLAIGAIGSPFPFLPRQLTLIGTFSIGIPGFFLALAPEVDLVRSGFLGRVLRFSIPAGLIAGTTTLIAYETTLRRTGLTLSEARTLATITLLGIGLAILVVASRPLQPWKFGLAVAMAASYSIILAMPFSRRFFELDLFTGLPWLIAFSAVAVGSVATWSVPKFVPGLDRAEDSAARDRRRPR